MPLVKAIIKERTRDEWLKRLDKAGVPSGAIRTVGEVCESEVLKARDMVAEMQHASAGIVKGIKSAMHLSQTPLNSYKAPPALGQHTKEVLDGNSRVFRYRIRSVGARQSGLDNGATPLSGALKLSYRCSLVFH